MRIWHQRPVFVGWVDKPSVRGIITAIAGFINSAHRAKINMGNPISPQIKTGTLGELLVQVRLLQFDVQAAPPIKDSGNDLIAVRGNEFRGIQVKTTTKGDFRLQGLPEYYHILALVDLQGQDNEIYLDQSLVFLIPRAEIENGGLPKDRQPFLIRQALVDKLFS